MVQSSNSRSIADHEATTDGAERIRKRAEARRLEILRAAARVFRRQGFAATGMREIAQEAELSPGNLYHYFSGKDEILFFCQDRSLEQLLASLPAEPKAGSCASALRDVIRQHVLVLLDSMEGAAAHLELDALPSERRATIVAKRDRYEKGIREIIRAGIEAGEFVEADPALLARTILGAINWPALWFRPDGQDSSDRIASSMAAYLSRGLARHTDEASLDHHASSDRETSFDKQNGAELSLRSSGGKS